MMLRASFLFITVAFHFPQGSGIPVISGICEPRSHSHPDFPKCPSKVCRQHIDCWVSYGPPQSCVCDPHLCGPVCLPVCFSPPYIPNTQVIPKSYALSEVKFPVAPVNRDDYKSGETIEITCMPGYRDPNRNLVEVTCVGSEWQFNKLNCERISCPPLRDPVHGKVVYKSDMKFQAEAISVCFHNYVADCESQMKVDEVTRERDCGSPPPILNGKLQANETTFGSKALIECPPDTTSSSEVNVMQCGVLGNRTTWLPQPTPACNRHCYLFTVDHGNVILMHKPNTPLQRLIPISSDDYNKPMGASENFKTNPLDGIILPYGRVRHGAQLNVTCNPGYQLMKQDSPVTICHDGVWSVRSKCVPGW
ncbi:uncharacterized protein DEA37_0001881 [Paragonimus westermani]|uniref:Sushi domain-containing protein n=1 Tax=Paragonimus westermani TaxID=34504 RepID=A0A5J4NRX6_9TREM|nr:uncharacterized protein DEA37_0001881 [Paragonimus westermani]